MKRVLSLTLCLLFFAAMFALPAHAAEQVTVTYNYMYNDLTVSETINKGAIPNPDWPSREGYEFFGYYADPGFTEKYDIGVPQYADVTVYLRWVSEEDIIYISLYHDSADEEPTAAAACVRGEAYGQPAEPAREGKVFAGWYYNRSCTVPYDPTRPLNSDIDLFACFENSWDDVTGYTIFDSPDAEEPAVGGYIRRNTTMFIPADPEIADGEMLLGWYFDRALTNEFDAMQPITQNVISLFPKVVQEEDVYWVSIYLDAVDDYPIGSGCVEKGSPIPEPETPGMDGFVFGGWYTDRALTHPADFTSPCWEDVELFPYWEEDHTHSLTEIPAIPATATADGRESYLLCGSCGKCFYNMASALIEVEDPESLVIPATGPFLMVDANGDSKVNIHDVTAIQRFLAQIDQTPFCRAAANVLSTDALNINDATHLQRYLAEYFSSL